MRKYQVRELSFFVIKLLFPGKREIYLFYYNAIFKDRVLFKGMPSFLDSVCKSWTLDSAHWTLNTVLWRLDLGRWTIDAGPWMLDYERWTLNAKLWMLDPGPCMLDFLLWTLDAGCQTLEAGFWALNARLWTLKFQNSKLSKNLEIMELYQQLHS